jgi:hypothetical protein
MEKDMRGLVLILALFLAGSVSAQVGITAGGSVLKSFGVPKPWGGLHFGFEVPRDDQVSIYGRVTHHFKQNSADSIFTTAIAKDVTTSPYTMSVSGVSSMNHTILEGGTRYYIGNGYDYGWAAYGGSNLMLIFNTVKNDFQDYDQVLYTLGDDMERKGSIVSFGFGLGGGVKYTITGVGTMYFDTNLNYIVVGLPSNNTAASTDLWRQLIFNFNLGFRKDILW